MDDDDAKFQWGIPDLDGLRDYLRKSMSWDRGEVDRVLLPIIRQMAAQASQQHTQSTLDNFFDSSFGMSGYHTAPRKHLIKSARLRKVVNGLTGQATTESETGASEKGAKRRKITTKKAAPKQAKSTVGQDGSVSGDDSENKSTVDGDSASVGGENDVNKSDDDVVIIEELKPQKRTRGRRTAQTKVPEAVTAAKRQLQSKNIEVKLAARDVAAAAAAVATATAIAEGDVAMSVPEGAGYPKGQKRVNHSGSLSSGGSDTSSGSDDDNDEQDFAPSHWDLLEERQRQHQQHLSPARKKTTTTSRMTSQKASSLTAMVSASNAARYGSVGSKAKKEQPGGRKKPRA